MCGERERETRETRSEWNSRFYFLFSATARSGFGEGKNRENTKVGSNAQMLNQNLEGALCFTDWESNPGHSGERWTQTTRPPGLGSHGAAFWRFCVLFPSPGSPFSALHLFPEERFPHTPLHCSPPGRELEIATTWRLWSRLYFRCSSPTLHRRPLPSFCCLAAP